MRPLKYFIYVLIVVIVCYFIIPIRREKLYPDDFFSFQILDRDGRLLREVLSSDYKTSIWKPIDEISPWMIKATIFREDKRFFFHPGVDLLALIRATYENVKYGRIISGGSTISMQVAKMALNIKRRHILAKLLEIIYAIKIDLHLSKKEILEIYLNRAPYGNQTYGVEAASRFYFRKPAEQLSLSESCMLSIIPKSPTLLNPYIFPEKIELAKNELLKKLWQRGIIRTLDHEIGQQESLTIVERDINFEAPHFVDYILSELKRNKIHKMTRVLTTIDSELQKTLENYLSTTIRSLARYNLGQGSILVLDTKTGDILAMVGSKDYFDAQAGQVNGCTSLRQPGSSIKPFLYALALMSGIPLSYILPDTLIEFNLPDGTRFAPRNYGERYHGPTRIREALASSFNVSAVYLAELLGIQRFYNLLKDLSFESLDKESKFYGLALSLGAGEVTLLEMVNGYRAFAKKGLFEPTRSIQKIYDISGNEITLDRAGPRRVFPIEVAYLIADILADNSSRIKAFGEDNPLNLPFACATKTGTSKDYRDNWCIGFTNQYVVGIWVGNFDGTPMQGVSGISGAAPIFRDIMIDLHKHNNPGIFERPNTLQRLKICAKSGKKAGNRCSNLIEEIFIPGTEPSEPCNICNTHQITYSERLRLEYVSEKIDKDIRIIKPTEGDIFKLDPQITYACQGIKFKAVVQADIDEVIFKLDGKFLSTEKYPFEYIWRPVPGKHRLDIMTLHNGVEIIDQVAFTVY